MENSLYAVMAVVGAVVLFVIHRITIELDMRGNSGRIFSRVIGVSALFCLCDAVWGVFASRANPSEYNFFVIASILFHVMATFIAYVWSMYTFSCLDIAIKGVYKVVAFIPFLAAFILILVTLPEGKIFIIDENMAYSSGAYRRILFIIQLGYLFVGMLVTVLTIKKKTFGDIEKRNIFRGMLT